MIDTEKLATEPETDTFLGKTVLRVEEMLRPLGEPGYRAGQIYKWIHHFNADTFDEMTNLPQSLRDTLHARFQIKTLQRAQVEMSADGTEKYLWRLPDNRHIESVLITEARRNTVCISSQVGCSLGCEFCATGQMGFIRNLTSGEIVEQVLQIRKLTKHPITNIVFMGMGEPFLNYHRAVQASRILSDPEGLAISAKKITFSTSGVVPKIYQFTDEAQPFKLAISLHAANQPLRERIMPIARKFPLNQLMESVRYYMRAKRQNRVTFEYILLHGINDSLADMKQLISLLSPIRCKLNLIPCNQNNLGFSAPPPEHLDKIREVIMKADFPVTIRKNRGEDITAACGQLAVEVSEKVIFMK